MRRVLLAVLACVVCCLLAVGVLADESSAYVHIDEMTGLRLTVPEGWSPPKITQDKYNTYAWFYSLSDSELFICAAISDYFINTAPTTIPGIFERAGTSREHYDNDHLPKESIAEAFQCNADDLTEVTYSGRTYYHTSYTFLSEKGLYEEYNSLLRMENGFLYMFGFSGEETHPNYEDFLRIVSEAEYPQNSEDEKTVMVRELLILLLSLVLHPIPVAVYRYGIRRCPLDDAKMVCVIYAAGAAVLANIILGFLNQSEVGAVLLGIVPAALLNYRMLSK